MPFRTIEFDGVTFDHLILAGDGDLPIRADVYRHVLLYGEAGQTVEVSTIVSQGIEFNWWVEVINHGYGGDRQTFYLSDEPPYLSDEVKGYRKAKALKLAIAYIKEKRAELAEKKRGVA